MQRLASWVSLCKDPDWLGARRCPLRNFLCTVESEPALCLLASMQSAKYTPAAPWQQLVLTSLEFAL